MLREIKAGFDPSQPRDEAGRWTDGGGVDDSELPPSETTMMRLQTMQRLLAVMRGRVRTTEDILAPKGKTIGQSYRGASDEVRTVTRKEFDVIKDELQKGAKEIKVTNDYKGRVFERSDGTRFGIRNSTGSGENIDIITSNSKLLEPGMKVHFKWK